MVSIIQGNQETIALHALSVTSHQSVGTCGTMQPLVMAAFIKRSEDDLLSSPEEQCVHKNKATNNW
jgi:hypothetical protein